MPAADADSAIGTSVQPMTTASAPAFAKASQAADSIRPALTSAIAGVTHADISENRLRRGVFTSVPELVAAIDEYVAHHNTDPKPIIRTKSARDLLQKVIRANARLRTYP